MHLIHIQSWQHLSKISVLASTFLLSVVLNNMALRYIPVSFVEVIAPLAQHAQPHILGHRAPSHIGAAQIALQCLGKKHKEKLLFMTI